MRWLGRLVRMPPGCLSSELVRACPSSRRPSGRPRTHWECLGVPPEELEEVAEEKVSLFLCDLTQDKWRKMDGWLIQASSKASHFNKTQKMRNKVLKHSFRVSGLNVFAGERNALTTLVVMQLRSQSRIPVHIWVLWGLTYITYDAETYCLKGNKYNNICMQPNYSPLV